MLIFLENCESIPAGTVGKVLSALTNMVKDSEIRKSLVENDGIWKVLASAISRVDHKRDEGSFDLRFVIKISMLLKIKNIALIFLDSFII